MKVWLTLLQSPLWSAFAVAFASLTALAILCWLMPALVISVAVSLGWLPRGQRFLIVYSDSAQWKAYFEEEVLPAFGASARVLNVSRDGGRIRWWHLAWVIHRYCGGYYNRFPTVYRFPAFGGWRSIRFYNAYQEAKKGKPAALDQAKGQLLQWRPHHT